MVGRIKDFNPHGNGEQLITVSVKDDFRLDYDTLKDCDVDITIKKHSKKRSNDANSYCWVLCGKLAEALSDEGVRHTKEDIYKRAIQEVGVYKDFCNLSMSDAKTLRTAWEMLGTGWITEQVDYSQDGDSVIVRCYYGSSQYNSKQMSRLIDSLVQDCKALEISTATPEQIEIMKAAWAEECSKRAGGK